MGVRVYIVKNSNIKNFTLNKNEKIDCHIKKGSQTLKFRVLC